MGYSVSKDVVRQRSEASRTHGARSQVALRRRSGYLKQSILQPLGLRHADLDQVARRYLDLLVRVLAKIEAYDQWASENGFIQSDGSTPSWIKEYYGAVNSASRLLAKLEHHLERHQVAGPTPLERHLAERYDVESGGLEVDEDG